VRVALPRARPLELEHPRLDIGRHHRLLGRLDNRQIVDVDVLETAREPGKRPGVLLNPLTAQVLDVVVVGVNPVKRRACGVNFVKIRQIVVDEVMKGLGRTHHGDSTGKTPMVHLSPRMLGRLYVVSTPIGNLEDITLRALSTLKSVGLIAAEDTRRTGILLRHFGISTSTTSLHEHNEHQKLPRLIQKLEAGTAIALVSDAGTPLVADPGQRLIAAAIEAGIRIVPIPGASAPLSALAISGFPADAFVFAGFAPFRSNERKKWLSGFQLERRPVVFFETPHRISRTLSEAGVIFGDRPICIARELTK
jgi:16S rRNA C1402 (ribose-2'-O) methylase RsmI